jgi:hypothetical protein
MDLEHEAIIELKLEKISEYLEDLVIDTLVTVLERLKQQNKAVLKSRTEDLIPF